MFKHVEVGLSTEEKLKYMKNSCTGKPSSNGGNPVPSLDPLIIINDLILTNKMTHIPRQYVKMRLNQLKFQIKRLQNGVETDKE